MEMKNNTNLTVKTLVILATAALITACASTTKIDSTPAGATLYINGEKAGTTPFTYTDTKIVGSAVQLKIKKEGYEEFQTTLTRSEVPDVGAIVGGVFALVPLLWCMKYKPTHTYELVALTHQQESPVPDYTQQIAPIKKGGKKKQR